MIFDKDANFPYPVLSYKSDSYEYNDFMLSINLDENTMNYKLYIKYNIESDFIKKLLLHGQAQLLLIIKSKDNSFYPIGIKQNSLEIPKSRLALSSRTSIQLFIQSKEEINFADNEDLNSFYSEFKDEIVVPKNALLGYSNTVVFDGSIKKPLDLFEKKVDETLKSDIKIQLSSETIVIVYKNKELQFANSSYGQAINNPYVYMGLQKALYRFIQNNSEENDDEVEINEIEVPYDALDVKLYNLMKRKMVDVVNYDNIDEVIYAISDKILDKYSSAVWRLQQNGN